MMGALAVALFRDMIREGFAPDRVAAGSTVPDVSGRTTASLHPFAVKLGLLRSSVVVCNTLLDAYSVSTGSSLPDRGSSRRRCTGTLSPTTP
jgi:hypothetical protein